MSRMDVEKARKARALLRRKRIFVFGELLSLLNCSVRTGRMRLKEWKAYSSYNKNGRYYAMPTVPRFDENGLWCYEGIRFSRHGNLSRTVVHLVGESPSGLSGKQLSKILGVPARSFLHHFRDVPGLCRQRHGGVYVYYCDRADRYHEQVQNRIGGRVEEAQVISDMDAVVILVALIKHHHIGVEDMLALPELQGRGVSRRSIELFLEDHGLEKKTPGTKP